MIWSSWGMTPGCYLAQRGNRRQWSVTGDQGTDTFVREDFQQRRVGHTAVDDMGGSNAILHGVQSAADLGQHTAVDGAIVYQLVDLFCGQSGQHFVFLALEAGHIG